MKHRYSFLVLLLWVGITASLLAQISYGGAPLPFSSEKLRAGHENLFIDMPAFDEAAELRASQEETSKFRSLQFAHKFFTHLRPDNSGIHFSTEDGTNVWRVGIRSKNAYSLNILFSKFRLPEGAKVFIYDPEQIHILGAFTHQNNSDLNFLPIQPIAGDALVIEYQEPEEAAFHGELEIGEVNHDFVNIFRATEPRDPRQDCHPNVVCFPEDAKPSASVVGLIINGKVYCTGSLVNNSAADGTPYLLTATHCLNSDYNARFLQHRKYDVIAGSIVAFFNYQSPICGENQTENIRGPLQMSMASLDSVYINEKHDISLLKFKEMPPREYQPYFSGWNVSASPKPIFHGIHHPNGGIKKVAIDNDNIKIGSFDEPKYNMTPESHWIIDKWDIGNTEPGSSGSPLYDTNKKIVGTLTAGESECKITRGPDLYAALYKAWNVAPNIDNPNPLKFYLDPTESGMEQIDGFNPYENEPMTKVMNFGSTELIEEAAIGSETLFTTNNTLGHTEFAEAFSFKDNTAIKGIFITSAAAKNIEEMDVKIKIYSGNEKPDRLLFETKLDYGFQFYKNGQFAVNPRNMNRKIENYVPFETPVRVSGKCYIAYSESNRTNPGFTVFNTKPREIGSEALSTAWIKSETGWIPASENIDFPMNTSLLIAPFIIGDTSSIIVPKKEDFELKVYYSKEEQRLFIVANKELQSWELFNVAGKKIYKGTFDKSVNRTSYPSTALIKGVYVLKVTTGQGTQAKKVIVY